MNKKQKNSMVLYANNLNDISFAELSKTENKIFRSIITKVINQETNRVEMSYDEIRDLIKVKRNFSTEELTQTIESLYDKLDEFFTYKVKSENNIIDKVHFFTRYKIDPNSQVALIAVHSDFVPFFNNLKDNFTYYELGEFVKLKNKYAILLYPLLMQYQNTGVYIVDFSKLVELLGLTPGLIKNLDGRVLIPAVNEINKVISDFELTYEKDIGYRKSIKTIKFQFKKRRKNKSLPLGTADEVDNDTAIETTNTDEHLTHACLLLGINSEMVNVKERTLVAKWYSEYGFEENEINSLITTAKNIAEKRERIMPGKTGLVNIAYIDGILRSWSSKGIKTVDGLPVRDYECAPQAVENDRPDFLLGDIAVSNITANDKMV